MECGICFNKFDEETYLPLTLMCGHTFCRNCMSLLFKESQSKKKVVQKKKGGGTKKSGGEVVCPNCNSAHRYHNSEAIPINYALVESFKGVKRERGDSSQLPVLERLTVDSKECQGPKMDSLILLYQTTICGNQESAKLLEGLSDSNIGHSKGYFALLLHWTEIYAVLRKDIPRANLLASEYLDIIKARGIRITDPKETEQLSFHEKFLVGRMLYDGIGTSKDTFAGYHLLVASADDGHPEALYRIGSHIQTEFGDLVESVERARGYLRSVVENFSHPQGTSMMARYLVMDGTTARCYFDQNVEVGLAMYHHAADQGYALAQTELANYYERKNYNMDEAMRLWLLAAEQGFTEAIIALGNQYFHTRRVLDLSEGLRWYRRSVELGDLEIIRVYHFIVERGYCNVSKNPRLLKRLSKMLPKEKVVLDLSIPSHRAMNNIYEFQEMSNYGYSRFKDVPAQLSFPRKPTMFG